MNARTILIELLFFATPFIIFGIYRLLVRDAEAHGKKSWPISVLFITGFLFALVGWITIILTQDDRQEVCYDGARRFVNGEFVEPKVVPCNRDLDSIGEALSTDPGGYEEDAPAPDDPQ
ncbi:MAG: hypothetical protein AAFX02_00800 [Pseudomonadota bacterium]